MEKMTPAILLIKLPAFFYALTGYFGDNRISLSADIINFCGSYRDPVSFRGIGREINEEYPGKIV
jgi:hypothetical protein